jgi:hypothetical protein
VEKPGEIELETHTLGKSSRWKKYRTKLRWFGHVKRMISIEYQKHYWK